MNDQQKSILLKEQIDLFPTLSDEELYAELTRKIIEINTSIAAQDIKKYLMLKGLWLPIKRAKYDSTELAIDALSTFIEFDLTDSEVYSMLVYVLNELIKTILVPSFTEQNKQDILQLGTALMSWADLYIPTLTHGDIAKARQL